MKKYNSPICEIENLTMVDVLTASSPTFTEFSFSDNGNLDNGINIDRVEW